MKNKRGDLRFLFAIVLMVVLSGVAIAIFAFPAGPTDLRAQACAVESASAVPEGFTTLCTGTYPAACPTDRISCNDATTQTATTSANNQYMGIRVSDYNTTVIDCGGITNVKLCYEWWSSSASISTCTVKVDANGGGSYSIASSTCPGTTANPGEICVDVTALESWTCSNFFGASGTRALAYLQVMATTGGAKTLTADEMYFNVTYSQDTTSPLISIVYPTNTTYNSVVTTLNSTQTDTNLQSCKYSLDNWATNTTFTCNTNVIGLSSSLGTNTWRVWANDSYGNVNTSSVTFYYNSPPTISNISIVPNPAGLLSSLTISGNGVADTNSDSLSFFCSETSSLPTDSGLCSGGGNITSIASPYYPSCSYYHNRAPGNYTVYCRLYDGNAYSSVVSTTYEALGDTLSTSIISVEGDASAAYFDTSNNGKTEILVSGSSGMSCRWSSSDLAYTGMSSSCSVVGSTANCTINDIVSQGLNTRYVACQDSYGNSQTAISNLNIDLYLDYTAPTTSDDSDTQINVPPYDVTITESDNVDSDPTTYYCTSSLQGCTPTTGIDNGGLVIFTSAERGTNYLRYYSVDDAGNSQTIVNKTINVNRLPVFSSANDNAATIKGGTSVTVSSVSYDPDSENMKFYVCNSSGATASGCLYGQHCSAIGASNLSCGFASESDTAVHTWYAYIYDIHDESATANNPITGTYTTDSSGPSITVTSPTNSSYTISSLSLEIVLDGAADRAWYSLDGAANVSLTNISSVQWTSLISGLSLGSHNVIFYANDSFDNLGYSDVIYFSRVSPSDSVPPVITINSPLNASYSSTSPLLNITSDESLNWAGYRLNGGSLMNMSNSSLTNWYEQLSLSDESTNSISIFANDTSNNQANTNITVYADSSAPRYSLLSANPGIANQSQNVNCSISWSDGFSITSVIISENSLGSYENHSISFSGNSGSASYLISGAKLTNAGTYTCNFYATDAAGNSNTTSTGFTVNDVTSPTITVTSPSNGGTYNQLSVPLSFVSSELLVSAKYTIDSGDTNVSMSNTSAINWNATLSGLTTGNSYTIIFYGTDSSGNEGSSGSKTFSVDTGLADTIPPVLTSTLTNASYKTSDPFKFNITSNEALNWSGYVLNGGSLTALNNISSVLWNSSLSSFDAESTNTLIVYGNDSYNNKGSLEITFYADSSAPRYSSLSVNPNPANESQNVVCGIFWNDTFSLTSVKISENASNSGVFTNHTIDLTSTGYANYTILNVQKGTYTCNFYATDAAGNSNTTSTTFTVNDVTAPSIIINSPLNISYANDLILFSMSTGENVSYANYTIDDGVTNVSLTGSTNLWSSTVSFETDGSKTVKFYTSDSSGNNATNSVTFYVDTSVNDITPPIITIWSPPSGYYYTTSSVLLNITSNENLAWAAFRNNSNALRGMDNVSLKNWNYSTAFAEGQHNISFFVNDTSTNKNQGNKNVTLYVDLTNPSISSFICADSNDSEDVNCSATISDAVGLDYAIVGYNATGVWQNSSNLSLSSNATSLSFSIYAGNTTPSGFGATLYLFDLSGRFNSSSDSVLITDDTNPLIDSISYIPNTTDVLDPGVNVSIYSNVTDDYSIGGVKLMYKESGDSGWSSLALKALDSFVANTSIRYYESLVLSEGTWYFKINATDAAGNENISSNYTLNVTNDVSINVTSTIPLIKSVTLAQRADNNSLGSITLNNTGDTSLNVSILLSSQTVVSRFNINNTGNVSFNLEIPSGEVVVLPVTFNSTGLSSVGLYSYNISVDSDAGTELYENYFNLQSADGAYLSVEFSSFSSSVSRGQSAVEYSAKITNLGTSSASDVYLVWNLPYDFSLSSGNLSRYFATLPIGVSSFNTITVNVSNSTTNSEVNISVEGSASNADSSSTSRIVSISDPLTVTNVIETTGGGSASRASSGGAGENVYYSKTMEIVRGKGDSFNIEVFNKHSDMTLKDITLIIDGILSSYIRVSPSSINSLGPRESANFSVSLKAPAYKENYEEKTLKATIKGTFVDSTGKTIQYQEIQNILLVIQLVSREDAQNKLDEAQNAINEMIKSGFKADRALIMYNQSLSKLNDRRNKDSYDLSLEVISIRDKAEAVNNLLTRIAEVLANPGKVSLLLGDTSRNISSNYNANYLIEKMKENSNWINELNKEPTNSKNVITGNVVLSDSSVNEMLNLALVAFERGDYDLAEERAKSAQNLIILDLKGNFLVFLYLYWYYIVIAFVLISLGGIFGYRRFQKVSISNRIDSIDKEEANLGKLMGESQRKYFAGKMSSQEYHRTMSMHQQELARIKKLRTNLRNIRVRMLKPSRVISDLDKEKNHVEIEIKRLQQLYYKDMKIDEKTYRLEFELFNQRLAEIEGERVTLQLMEKKESHRSEFAKKEEVPIAIQHKKEIVNRGPSIFKEIFSFIKKPFNYISVKREQRIARREKEIRDKVNKMLGLV